MHGCFASFFFPHGLQLPLHAFKDLIEMEVELIQPLKILLTRMTGWIKTSQEIKMY